MNITQSFYDKMAPQYDKLFADWHAATQEQAAMLDRLFADRGLSKNATVLDCACGIGTQCLGLAKLGYAVTASDLSQGALAEARKRAAEKNLSISFQQADFCALSETFSQCFDIVMVMDNALPHMLTPSDLERAVKSMLGQVKQGGLLIASIRDYDELLTHKPPCSSPYIHQTPKGQKVSFQTWTWRGDNYRLVQYIIDDEDTLNISKFECEYRATCREELTSLLLCHGCSRVHWLFPCETGFYQPIVIGQK
ncbi:MAG: class I SAM-dependent methyltransferase [Clostridia bacterium]|nr:class I SAM-dependent methyltransferase [Clostridia bacterium]